MAVSGLLNVEFQVKPAEVTTLRTLGVRKSLRKLNVCLLDERTPSEHESHIYVCWGSAHFPKGHMSIPLGCSMRALVMGHCLDLYLKYF